MGEPSNDITVITDLEAEHDALKESRTGLGLHDGAPDELDGKTPN
jgi:hypothetical protein